MIYVRVMGCDFAKLARGSDEYQRQDWSRDCVPCGCFSAKAAVMKRKVANYSPFVLGPLLSLTHRSYHVPPNDRAQLGIASRMTHKRDDAGCDVPCCPPRGRPRLMVGINPDFRQIREAQCDINDDWDGNGRLDEALNNKFLFNRIG